MADAADDRDLVAKSVRPVGPQAIPSRSGEAMRRLADLTYPLKPDGESRCLSVGRGISLSGEVNSCDKLLIEGSVDAKLTNCRAIEIAVLNWGRLPCRAGSQLSHRMIDPVFINIDYAGARRGLSPYRCGRRRSQLTCAGPCRIRNPERTVVLSLREKPAARRLKNNEALTLMLGPCKEQCQPRQ